MELFENTLDRIKFNGKAEYAVGLKSKSYS